MKYGCRYKQGGILGPLGRSLYWVLITAGARINDSAPRSSIPRGRSWDPVSFARTLVFRSRCIDVCIARLPAKLSGCSSCTVSLLENPHSRRLFLCSVKLVWGRYDGGALLGAPMQDSERLRPYRISQDTPQGGTDCLSLGSSGPSAAWGTVCRCRCRSRSRRNLAQAKQASLSSVSKSCIRSELTNIGNHTGDDAFHLTQQTFAQIWKCPFLLSWTSRVSSPL